MKFVSTVLDGNYSFTEELLQCDSQELKQKEVTLIFNVWTKNIACI